jgi:hypothetical protein
MIFRKLSRFILNAITEGDKKMAESFLGPKERRLFNYVFHFSSEVDIVDENGVVYTHINSFKDKELVKDTARQFKRIFPKLRFRTTRKRDYKGKPIGYSLYADIMTFYNMPYHVCFELLPFKHSDHCKECSKYENCLRLHISNQEVSNKK